MMKTSTFIKNGYIQGIATGLIVAGIIFLINDFKKPKDIFRVKYEGSIVMALNKDWNTLWVKDIRSEIEKDILADIDNDGRNEIVIGTSHNGADPGTIIVLSRKGGILWKFNTYPESFPYAGGNSRKFTVRNLLAVDLDNDGSLEIIATGHDPTWYASRIVIISEDGMLAGEYFHPGQLSKIVTAEMISNGRKAIIASGCNNDLRQVIKGSNDHDYYYSLFLLDSKEIWGQAPPYFGRKSYFGNKWRGSEKWYGVMLPQGNAITSLDVENQTGFLPLIKIAISDGRFYSLNLKGEIVSRGLSDSWIEEHGKKDLDSFFFIEDILK